MVRNVFERLLAAIGLGPGAGSGRLLVRSALALLTALVGYVLFFEFSDIPGALTRMGPYQGQVIDAETGKSVPNAYVVLSWASQDFFRGSNCVNTKILQTDEAGQYRIGWQGLRFLIAPGVFAVPGLTKIYSPSISGVLAVGYRPWGSNEDRPAWPIDQVPRSGSPFTTSQVGLVKITPMRDAGYTDKDWSHLGMCAATQEGLIRYIRFRADWDAQCGPRHSSHPQSEAFSSLVDRLPDAALRDRIVELIGYTPQMAGRSDLIPNLTEEKRSAACELARGRMPTFEDFPR